MEKPYFVSAGHDSYKRLVIRSVAASIRAETGRWIPEDVMFVGQDWVYLGKVRCVADPVFAITPVSLFALSETVTVAQMLKELYPQTRRIALIPEDEQRVKEARELGDVVDEQKFSFRVRTAEHDVSVYMMRDARHVIRDTDKLSSGGLVGWTEILR